MGAGKVVIFLVLLSLWTSPLLTAAGLGSPNAQSQVYGDDRDKEQNPKYKTLGKYSMPIGRPRTEQEIRESIAFARRELLSRKPLQAELIKRLAAIELGAIRRKPNDKAPSLVLQGLPGVGKSTIFPEWLELRDKLNTYNSEVMNEKTVEFPVDSILRTAPKVKNRQVGETLPEYYDGLDHIFTIDEVDKMRTLQELKNRHDEIIKLGQAAVEMQIKGQAGSGLNGPGSWVTPSDLLRFENPITEYEERMRSLARLWSILDSGFAVPAPLHSAQTYIHLFNKQLDKVSAAQNQIDAISAQIEKYRQSSAGGTALAAAEIKTKQFEATRDQVVEEIYRLMRNMRIDYEPMFTKEEMDTPYQTLAETFVKDPAKAKEFIKSWNARVPTTGRGQQYDMRGQLTVWSQNSPQLRQLRELYEHRKLPATPSEAQAAVKALEPIFLDDFEALFHDRFTTKEGGKRRFNFEGFQKLIMVPSEEDWRRAIDLRLKSKAKDLIELVKQHAPNLEVVFDPNVQNGLYDLTVDGLQGWDDWRTKFDLYTKTFFSELMYFLEENPKNKIQIAIDPKRGSFAVYDMEISPPDPIPQKVFDYKPTEKTLEALHQPKKSQKLDSVRRSYVSAARAVVATSLFGAIPRSDDTFTELDHGYGMRARYDAPNADILEYELKVALAELAGFVWQREDDHRFDVSHDVSIDYDRAYRVLEFLMRDPQLKEATIRYLDGYAKRHGINSVLPGSWKINRLLPLDDVLPVHLRDTVMHRKLQADSDMAYILRAMYALDAYILKRNKKTVGDVARRHLKLVDQSRDASDEKEKNTNPEISEKEFKEIIKRTYRGGWGQQPLGRIVTNKAGTSHLRSCEFILADVTTRGRIGRGWRAYISAPGRIKGYRFSEWWKRTFRNN